MVVQELHVAMIEIPPLVALPAIIAMLPVFRFAAIIGNRIPNRAAAATT